MKQRGISSFHRRGSRGESPSPNPGSSDRTNTRGESPFRLRGLSPFRRRGSSSSLGSNDSGGSGGGHHHHHHSRTGANKTHNILVCHENARSIVFRDHLRHVTKIVEEEELDEDDLSESESESEDDPDLSQIRNSMRDSIRASLRQSITSGDEINLLAQSLVPELAKDVNKMHVTTDRDVQIEHLHVHMTPLPELDLGPKSPINEILEDPAYSSRQNDWTEAEKEVYELFQKERACVKTIKNSEWGIFLNRFNTPSPRGTHRRPHRHDDIGPHGDVPFNSFYTSTTLLPSTGGKMRCYGSLTAYNAGVVFALPKFATSEAEEEEVKRTETWGFPAGYSAKTEFNIDDRGRLINGRQEALVSLNQLRQYNDEYMHKKDHIIAGKVIKGGFNVIPFNEVYVRVGGCDRFGRNVRNTQGSKGGGGKSSPEEKKEQDASTSNVRSLEHGVGLPVALFMRDNTIEDVMSLFRIKSRFAHFCGEEQANEIPLLYISHERGIRILTERFQPIFWKKIASNVNPFQNPILEPLTQLDDTKESCLQQKKEELVDIYANKIDRGLTHEECALVVGGFGATDESILRLLEQTRSANSNNSEERVSVQSNIQTAIEAGLASAVRCGDYYNARQLLILYCHAASSRSKSSKNLLEESAFTYTDLRMLDEKYKGGNDPSCPPVINIERLRSAVSF